MKQKFWTVLLASITTVGLCLGVTACHINGDSDDPDKVTVCEHLYSDWEEGVAATCTSIGYDERTCEICGDVDYRFHEARDIT